MVQKSIKMLFVSTLLLVFAIVVIQGCCCRDRYYVETITRASEDTTYCIIDGKNNEIVYHAGYNPISKEEVIKGTYIFIENIATEECSDRIIVCDPDQQLVLVAYNLGWCFNFEGDDWQQLVNGVDKEYSIKKLDLKNKEIHIQFFNKDILSLELNDIFGL